MAADNLDDLLYRLTNVNTDGIPDWALLLFDCFKGVITTLKDNKSLNVELNNLQDECNALKTEIKTLKKNNDDLEQRGRNDCLVLHGYEEAVDENTETIICAVIGNELGISLTENDIKNSHRLGPPRTQRSTRTSTVLPRPIIFRLMYFRKRIEIYGNKRKLKGKKLVITENLTSSRYKVYKAAMEKFGKANVWTKEGRIIMKLNNKVHSFTTMDEVEEL